MQIKIIGLKIIFLNSFIKNFIGIIIIKFIIFLIIEIMKILAFIKMLLKINKYSVSPIKTPKNRNTLISPLLNFIIEYKSNNPVIIPNKTSSMYVTKSGVLKLLLRILKQSKSIPIKTPLRMKIKKTNTSLCKISPYLNILLKNEVSLLLLFLSE